MKALLIDDERLARNELRRLLAVAPDITIVGEAGHTVQARELMATLNPDLLFLDVQMPGETGVEFLATLEPPVPHVIFTTAYDEFAVKAFELNALDYLLNPVDPARLALTLDKLRDRANPGAGAASPLPRASRPSTRSSSARATAAGLSKSAPSASSKARATTPAFTSTTPNPSSSVPSTRWKRASTPRPSSAPTAAR